MYTGYHDLISVWYGVTKSLPEHQSYAIDIKVMYMHSSVSRDRYMDIWLCAISFTVLCRLRQAMKQLVPKTTRTLDNS